MRDVPQNRPQARVSAAAFDALIIAFSGLSLVTGVALIGCFEVLQAGAQRRLYRALADDSRRVDTLAFVKLGPGLVECGRFLLTHPRHVPHALLFGVYTLLLALFELCRLGVEKP